MAAVTIRCPETGQTIPTGIETEPEDFKRLPRVDSRLICPACGREHVWNAAEAFLAPLSARSAA
jgi:hypothetical protein